MTDILSQFIGLSFPSPWGSFHEKKILNFNIKIIIFYFYILHGYLGNPPLPQGHKDVAPYIVTLKVL